MKTLRPTDIDTAYELRLHTKYAMYAIINDNIRKSVIMTVTDEIICGLWGNRADINQIIEETSIIE
jgi:hypothetical protein